MSMQSHLAELEKKHRALEAELNDCLAHPATDDLRLVELKRKKLLVKDEIERLRHNGLASVHCHRRFRFYQVPIDKPPARGREAAVLRFSAAVRTARAMSLRPGTIQGGNTAHAEYRLGTARCRLYRPRSGSTALARGRADGWRQARTRRPTEEKPLCAR